jgi:hypothetical protein
MTDHPRHRERRPAIQRVGAVAHDDEFTAIHDHRLGPHPGVSIADPNEPRHPDLPATDHHRAAGEVREPHHPTRLLVRLRRHPRHIEIGELHPLELRRRAGEPELAADLGVVPACRGRLERDPNLVGVAARDRAQAVVLEEHRRGKDVESGSVERDCAVLVRHRITSLAEHRRREGAPHRRDVLRGERRLLLADPARRLEDAIQCQ